MLNSKTRTPKRRSGGITEELEDSVAACLEVLSKEHVFSNCLVIGNNSYFQELENYFTDIEVLIESKRFTQTKGQTSFYHKDSITDFVAKNIDREYSFVILGRNGLSKDDNRRLFVDFVRSNNTFVLVDNRVYQTDTRRMRERIEGFTLYYNDAVQKAWGGLDALISR